MVVKNDEIVRSFVFKHLIQLGYNLFQASLGLEAVNVLIKMIKIWLTFSAIIIPKMNGNERSGEVKK